MLISDPTRTMAEILSSDSYNNDFTTMNDWHYPDYKPLTNNITYHMDINQDLLNMCKSLIDILSKIVNK